MTEEKITMPVMPIEVTGDSPREQLQCVLDKLETGVKAVFESDAYVNHLKFLSSFHHYSANNMILILMQKPDATLVAGYNDWAKKYHRYVKRGERGIRILAPAPYKAKMEKEVIGEDGVTQKVEVEIKVPAFKIVTCFDVSQTVGEPLPSYGVTELDGTVERYAAFGDALVDIAPCPIDFEDIPGASHGYYHLTERRIAIRSGMSQLQVLKTCVHETAHATLHALPEDGSKGKNPLDRHTKEVQAEAVAYVVCEHYGLDTSDYSFAYIAGWSKGREVPELKASLEVIRTTAHEMIVAIDTALANQAETEERRRKVMPSRRRSKR